MTNDEINERIAEITGFHDKVGLKKRGLWYLPKACGYTNQESEAGRFTLEEAKKREHLHDEPVTIHRFKTPKYTESLDACREFMEKIHGSDREEFAIIARYLERVDTLYEAEEQWALITLTPLELCEVLLRLKGQWE